MIQRASVETYGAIKVFKLWIFYRNDLNYEKTNKQSISAITVYKQIAVTKKKCQYMEQNIDLVRIIGMSQ